MQRLAVQRICDACKVRAGCWCLQCTDRARICVNSMRASCAQAIYERLEELDPSTFETDAIKLLTGLGFTQKMMAKCTKVRRARCHSAAPPAVLLTPSAPTLWAAALCCQACTCPPRSLLRGAGHGMLRVLPRGAGCHVVVQTCDLRMSPP